MYLSKRTKVLLSAMRNKVHIPGVCLLMFKRFGKLFITKNDNIFNNFCLIIQ